MPWSCVCGARGRFGRVGAGAGCCVSPVSPCPPRVSCSVWGWPSHLGVPYPRSLVRHSMRSVHSAGSVRLPFWFSPRLFCVCVRSRSRGARAPPPLPGLVWRAHLARSRCWALVGPFHSVRAPPRVRPRSRAPSGLLAGGWPGCCLVLFFFPFPCCALVVSSPGCLGPWSLVVLTPAPPLSCVLLLFFFLFLVAPPLSPARGARGLGFMWSSRPPPAFFCFVPFGFLLFSVFVCAPPCLLCSMVSGPGAVGLGALWSSRVAPLLVCFFFPPSSPPLFFARRASVFLFVSSFFFPFSACSFFFLPWCAVCAVLWLVCVSWAVGCAGVCCCGTCAPAGASLRLRCVVGCSLVVPVLCVLLPVVLRCCGVFRVLPGAVWFCLCCAWFLLRAAAPCCRCLVPWCGPCLCSVLGCGAALLWCAACLAVPCCLRRVLLMVPCCFVRAGSCCVLLPVVAGCSLLGLVASCCFPPPCVVAGAPARPPGLLPCCVLWFVVMPRSPVLCPVFCGAVLL